MSVSKDMEDFHLVFSWVWWQKTQDLKWCYSAVSQGRAPMSKGRAIKCLSFPLSSHPHCSPSPGKRAHPALRGAVDSLRLLFLWSVHSGRYPDQLWFSGIHLYHTSKQQVFSQWSYLWNLDLSVALSLSHGYFWRLQTSYNRVFASK